MLVRAVRLKYRVMKKFLRMSVAVVMALTLAQPNAQAAGNATKSTTKKTVNWNPVMDAIIQVESEGNPNAVSGASVGAMQITPILVKDCNEILKRQKSKKRFTLADRYNVAKSKEMFLLIQSYYNPENSIEKAIRSWNGGVKYSVKATNGYYRKVMNKMK